jgi:hypothetical protein
MNLHEQDLKTWTGLFFIISGETRPEGMKKDTNLTESCLSE